MPRRTTHHQAAITLVVTCVWLVQPNAAHADIFRWDNGQVIPGTIGITPGPGVQLDHRDLQLAYLGDGSQPLDLTGASFASSNLRWASLWLANLTKADCAGANLTFANLDGSTLTNANLSGANLTYASFTGANVTNANFADANLTGVWMSSIGFTKEQLYTTASYRDKKLQSVILDGDFTGADFSQIDFSGVDSPFYGSTLSGVLDDVDLSGTNLMGAQISSSLIHANLSGANLSNTNFQATTTNANFDGAMITGAYISGLTNVQLYSTQSYREKNLQRIVFNSDLNALDLREQNLTGAVLNASLSNTDLSGAVVARADFYFATSRGFTKEQLYSTASYVNGNLQGIVLARNNLTGWNFAQQDLTDANFSDSTLTNADFTGAVLEGAGLFRSIGFTRDQLYSTASYQQKALRRVNLPSNIDLSAADFKDQDLTGSSLMGTNVANADFSGAIVENTRLNTSSFTKEQLYTTRSYQEGSLRGVTFPGMDGWDLSGQDLTGAGLTGLTLSSNIADATINDALLRVRSFGGMSEQQLYSTASYQQGNLRGIRFVMSSNLDSLDFSGKDLSKAEFGSLTLLSRANFSNANLTNAAFQRTSFTDAGDPATRADFSGAIIRGVEFNETSTLSGFTKELIYVTASYQQKDLRGVGFHGVSLIDWDFSGQDLSNADFSGTHSGVGIDTYLSNVNFGAANLQYARFFGGKYGGGSYGTMLNFSGADLRGAWILGYLLTGATIRNTILPATPAGSPYYYFAGTDPPRGEIWGLDLQAGDTLVVRDFDAGISVLNSFAMAEHGLLELLVADADWNSTITLVSGIVPELGGTLKLRFTADANLASIVGSTVDLFDWPAPLNSSNRFDQIDIPLGTQWDFTLLYTTGEVTLLAVPEPSAFTLGLLAVGVLTELHVRRCRGRVQCRQSLN